MCFIKSSCVGSRSLFQSAPFVPPTSKPSESSLSFGSSSSLGSISHKESFPQLYGPDCSMLAQLCSSLVTNSQLLLKLQQKIDASETMLEEVHSLCQSNELTLCQQDGETAGESWRSDEPIVEKLFGEKNYMYKLRLRGKFPTTIYKQRNIGLAVELVDAQGKLVLNSNLIGLCLSACETTAQWIPQNEEGDYFVKGKTQVDLYHGEAIYQKVYPRDVSRQYSEGKINLVIYPKPSLIQFSSYSSTLESRVRSEEIEPLMLKDITIRAKKKSN